ncbi:MAG: ABC transporter permease [Sneathiella sp.]|nr:ABC transporter permease [Sneathiella sp.]
MDNFDDVSSKIVRRDFDAARALMDGPSFKASPAERAKLEFMYCIESLSPDIAVDVAFTAFDEGHMFCPSFSTLPWLLDSLASAQRFSQGLQLIRFAKSIGYVGWEAQCQEVRFLALTRKIAKAQKLLREIWPNIPISERPDIGVFEGRLLHALNRRAEAFDLFKRHLKRSTARELIHDRVILLAMQLRDWPSAKNIINLSIHRFGGNVDRFRQLSLVSLALGANGQALTFARKAQQIALKNPILQKGKAQQRRKVQGDIRDCQRLIVKAHIGLNRVDQALIELRGFVKQDPKWALGKMLQMECCISLGFYDEAFEVLASLHEQGFASPRLHKLQGQLLIAVGDLDGASGALVELKERWPNHPAGNEVELLIEEGIVGDNKRTTRIFEGLQEIVVPDIFLPQWTTQDTRPSKTAWRDTLESHFRSIGALLLRESHAQYGRHSLGFLWAILDPAAQVAILVAIFAVIGKHTFYDMSLPLFIATGLIPFQLFSKIFGQMLMAVKSNQALLLHPRVKTIDVFTARVGLELTVSFLLFCGFIAIVDLLEGGIYFDGVFPVLLGFLGLVACGMGFGIMIDGIASVFPSVATIAKHSTRLLYFTSGVFFTPEMLPPNLREFMMLNPLMQYVSMIRSSFSPLLDDGLIDYQYAFIWAIGLLVMGLAVERVFRDKMMLR